MEPRAQRLVLARTPALPVRRRSARYGAGGDIAAQCPYHKRQEKEEGRMQNGAAAAADASASVKGENVRLCSPMFAYVRLIGKKCLRACLETTRGAVFVERAGWRGATKENIPGGSSTEEQRSQAALSAKTLRAAGLLSVACVGSAVTARCGDAPASPPWPQPKSLAAAPLVIFKQALRS